MLLPDAGKDSASCGVCCILWRKGKTNKTVSAPHTVLVTYNCLFLAMTCLALKGACSLPPFLQFQAPFSLRDCVVFIYTNEARKPTKQPREKRTHDTHVRKSALHVHQSSLLNYINLIFQLCPFCFFWVLTF